MHARAKLSWFFLVVPLILSVNVIGITEAQETHDIAVTSITLARVATGELVNITVVAKNNGTVNETFNVTLYYDSALIGTQNVTDLASSTNTTLLFVWNTTGILAGTYTVKAMASKVEGEMNIANNVLTLPFKVEIKSTYIAVVPQSIVDLNLTPGKNFTVSIYTDYNGSDVYMYQFTLSYNPLVLHGVEVTNGDLITEDKDPSARFEAGTFNNALGKLSLTVAYFFFTETPVPTTSGPGILANVTFTVVGTGDSDITLDLYPATIEREAILFGINATTAEIKEIINYYTPEKDHILDSFFQNMRTISHDIAVTSVTPSPTSVERGKLVNITVTVKNSGTVNEDVTVEVYRSIGPYQPGYSDLIGTKTAQNLEVGSSTSLTFAWDTTDAKLGNYTITAVASIPSDTDTLQSEEKVEVKRREEEPIPILLIVGIVAAVAILIAIVVYVVRRR